MTEFENLFRENHDMIFKYLIKLTKDISLAEELTSETFYRAYMNYSGLRDKSKANVWLCKIAKNVFYSKISEQKKTQSFDYDKFVHLHYLDELSYDEIAIVLHKNKTQLKNLSYRAKAALKELYEKEGGSDEID